MSWLTDKEPRNYLGADGVVVTQGHRQAQRYLPVVDRILEPQTVVQFAEFCADGRLPNGRQTSLPLLSGDEQLCLPRPWNEWAPPPHDVSSQQTMHLLMSRVGSMEDSDRLMLVGKNIHALKSRLWEGILPMSDTRWRLKELDKAENFGIAIEHLSAVVAVFEYLNSPVVMGNLRETFNLMSKHLSDFDAAVNALRASNGTTPVSTAALWEEFMYARYQVMTTRAHDWVMSRILPFRELVLRELSEHQPPSETEFSDKQKELADKIHILAELEACANIGIMMPMEGYTGYSPPTGVLNSDLRSPIFDVRRKAHAEQLKFRSRVLFFKDLCANLSTRPEILHSDSNSVGMAKFAKFQARALDWLREEMRGESVRLPEENWITRTLRWKDLMGNKGVVPEFGFDVYRLTYGSTEGEWTDFVQKVEEYVSNWGEGVSGADKIRSLLKLRCRDGKELGIPEGDIEAAKKHFRDNCAEDSFPHWNVMLVVDEASFFSFTTDSYAMPTETKLPFLSADFGPFILAVDPEYDPNDPDPEERKDEHPGYEGVMRIQPGLIWSDLFAMLASSSAHLEDLWPLAMDHPHRVYTGATVPSQVEAWRRTHSEPLKYMRMAVDFIKKRFNME